MNKISGIYKITNIQNSKCYYGKSIDIIKRWERHKSCLKNNSHWNIHLQNAYNFYGKNNFIYEIIESCLEEELIKREQYNLDVQKMIYGDNSVYNTGQCTESPMKGRNHTEKTKQKITKAQLGEKNHFFGKHHSEESKQKFRKTLIREGLIQKLKEEKIGEKNPSSKLTWEQVDYIRKQYKLYKESQRKLGFNQKQLAKEFNVHQTTVGDILNNKRWKV